jgi:hypothetical protein
VEHDAGVDDEDGGRVGADLAFGRGGAGDGVLLRPVGRSGQGLVGWEAL